MDYFMVWGNHVHHSFRFLMKNGKRFQINQIRTLSTFLFGVKVKERMHPFLISKSFSFCGTISFLKENITNRRHTTEHYLLVSHFDSIEAVTTIPRLKNEWKGYRAVYFKPMYIAVLIRHWKDDSEVDHRTIGLHENIYLVLVVRSNGTFLSLVLWLVRIRW